VPVHRLPRDPRRRRRRGAHPPRRRAPTPGHRAPRARRALGECQRGGHAGVRRQEIPQLGPRDDRDPVRPADGDGRGPQRAHVARRRGLGRARRLRAPGGLPAGRGDDRRPR
jgi:hypothetical protein